MSLSCWRNIWERINPLNSNVIVRAPLHVQVAERLRFLIDSGELAPGTRLNENELCRNMGVSRTPLREAIRSLATEGLVELQPNRGAIVSVVSQDDVTEILPIMASLEGLGGRLAADAHANRSNQADPANSQSNGHALPK